MDKFKIGDVVQLKSGNTKMTVGDAELRHYLPVSPGECICDWFVGGTLHTEKFRIDELQIVIEEQK